MDEGAFLGLDRDRDGLIILNDFKRLSQALKPPPKKRNDESSSPKKKKSRVEGEQEQEEEEEEPVLLDELRLKSPEEEPADVIKAMAKWCHVARWMAAASQRSIA